jgi:hypothetical protein
MDADKLKSLADRLLQLAAIFRPDSALALRALVEAATELNSMVALIKGQTAENSEAVWDAVAADYAKSLAEFEAVDATK